ncbi:MAG: hypothetical protein ABIP63_03185 [Thermoanaerobaculia bacterium]
MSDADPSSGVAAFLQEGDLTDPATDVPLRADLLDLHDAID